MIDMAAEKAIAGRDVGRRSGHCSTPCPMGGCGGGGGGGGGHSCTDHRCGSTGDRGDSGKGRDRPTVLGMLIQHTAARKIAPIPSQPLSPTPSSRPFVGRDTCKDTHCLAFTGLTSRMARQGTEAMAGGGRGRQSRLDVSTCGCSHHHW